jgi:hypothetical protein
MNRLNNLLSNAPWNKQAGSLYNTVERFDPEAKNPYPAEAGVLKTVVHELHSRLWEIEEAIKSDPQNAEVLITDTRKYLTNFMNEYYADLSGIASKKKDQLGLTPPALDVTGPSSKLMGGNEARGLREEKRRYLDLPVEASKKV